MASCEEWCEKLSADPFCRSRNRALELVPPFLSSGGRGDDSAEAYRIRQSSFPENLAQDVSMLAEVAASERELLDAQKRGDVAALTGALISRSYYVAAGEAIKQEALRLKRERKDARRKEKQMLTKPRIIQSEAHRKRNERFQSVAIGAAAQLEKWRQEIANLQSQDGTKHPSRHASPVKHNVPHLPIWLAQAEKEVDDGEQAIYDLNLDNFREKLSTMSKTILPPQHYGATVGDYIVTQPTHVDKLEDMIRLVSSRLDDVLQPSTGAIDVRYSENRVGSARPQQFVGESVDPSRYGQIAKETACKGESENRNALVDDLHAAEASIQRCSHTDFESLSDAPSREEPISIAGIRDMIHFGDVHVNDRLASETDIDNLQPHKLRHEEEEDEAVNDTTQVVINPYKDVFYANAMLDDMQIQQPMSKSDDFSRHAHALTEPTCRENVSEMRTLDHYDNVMNGTVESQRFLERECEGINPRQAASEDSSPNESKLRNPSPRILSKAVLSDAVDLLSTLDNTWDADSTRIQEHSKPFGSPEASSAALSSRSGTGGGAFVDLFALAPSQFESKVDWVVKLDQNVMEPSEPIVQQNIEDKVGNSEVDLSLPADPYEELYRNVYTWNAWEQIVEQGKRTASSYIDSPEFTLSGVEGFYLRYWPHWDVANDNACLRVFGPPGCHSHCRLGIDDACFCDVEITHDTVEKSASQVWFFASSEIRFVRNLENVWVAEPDYI